MQKHLYISLYDRYMGGFREAECPNGPGSHAASTRRTTKLQASSSKIRSNNNRSSNGNIEIFIVIIMVLYEK